MKKIAVLGGSFDPCHIGHINLALDAKRQYKLDQVILVPAKLQPFKINNKTIPAHMRYEMLSDAVKEFSGLKVSSLELNRNGLSYTYLTMRQIRDSLDENVELYFLLGTDAFLSIESWEKSEEFLRENNFLIGSRPGYREEELNEAIEQIGGKYQNKILIVDNRKYHISSTEIRERLREGKSISTLVSSPVDSYIRKHKIYTDGFCGRKDYFGSYIPKKGNSPWKIEDMSNAVEAYIRDNISDRRTRHIFGVVKLGEKLAKRYGVDANMVRLSALCHDLAKEFPMFELNDLIDLYNIPREYINKPNLSHSKVAAYLIEDYFQIDNQKILNMVSYHTTGRKGMSLEEKIIFISDMTEENRDFKGVESIRQLLFKDIDQACLLALEHTIGYLERKGNDVHKDSLEARAWLKATMKGEGYGN